MTRATLVASVFAWAVRAGFAILGARPLVGLAAAVIGEHPRGDAVVWDEGGAWLLEVADEGRAALRPVMVETAGGAFVGLLAWSIAIGAMLSAARAGASSDVRTWGGLALRRASSLALIGALELAAKAAMFLFSGALVGFAWRLVEPTSRGPNAFVVGAGLGACAAWLLGVVIELARAELVWVDAGIWGSLVEARAWLRARSFEVLRAAGVRALTVALGLGLVSHVVTGSLPTHPYVALVAVLFGAAVPVVARARFHAALAACFEAPPVNP
ncbi:MAG: hypothetical protein FJ095_14380 [Deltaproteobacteria bacterium]|nr:hypothetical protein [Deltaproteobacteria bacterium]